MDQILLLDATERYLKGEMTDQERQVFEELRKTNSEIDQFVVEHHFFTEEMERYGDLKRFKSNLYDIHHTLKESGEISDAKISDKGKVIQIWEKYRKTIAVAASIAGFTALFISGSVMIFSSKTPIRDIEELRRKVNTLEVRTQSQDVQINDVKKKISPGTNFSFGGTSFLIDGKGYLITSAHVVENAKTVFVQNNKGNDFQADIIYSDKLRDLALLKINDEEFKTINNLPYGFRRNKTELAEPVFTLGYPKDEIVYGEGYLSALTGLQGDTMTSQITISANPGNSGGPIINKYGEVIGMLNARQTTAEGVVFAIKSKHIIAAIEELKKNHVIEPIKLSVSSSVRGMERVQQVKKIEDCIYMVKVAM
ncbi:MAG: S1C family serine protease [Chitinophagaceae bacterium]